MTMVEERAPFEPIGEIGRSKMIIEGIASLPPLEANTVITYEMISNWLGQSFPIPRVRCFRGEEFVVPDYSAMDDVRKHMIERRQILLVAEPNLGWRVATDEEKAIEAEALWLKAEEVLKRSSIVARSVNRSRISAAQAAGLDDLQEDVRRGRLLISERARARAEKIRKFGTPW